MSAAAAVRHEHLTVAGTRLHLQSAGDGPPLLYLHGANGVAWLPGHERLAERCRLLLPEHPGWGAGLLGDKTHSVIFDNTKIKRFVPGFTCTIPFAQGAQEIVDFYAANPKFEPINSEVDQLMDRLAERFKV